MDVLLTLNETYLAPARTLLYSLSVNNPGESFVVHLLHRSLSDETLQRLEADLARIGCGLRPLRVDEALFEHAPVSARYPQEMYYRLMAPHLLPSDCRRVLYLDPDMLVINPVRPLVDTDLHGNAFAAAAHTQRTELPHQLHQARLNTESRYFNSGMLLMDVPRARRRMDPDALFAYVERNGDKLLLPDQDVFNALLGDATHEVDDAVWNYDARNYNTYLLRSKGEATADWVMANTAVLHFCGRPKPWNKRYPYRFGTLYKHYRARAERVFA